jgi:hypothetical protein
MNDLDQLRQLRAEIPYPERSRLARGRSRLLSEAGRTPRPAFARGRRGAIVLPAVAVVAGIVAGVAGYGLTAGSHPAAAPAAPKAAPTATAAPQRATLAARVLRAASAAAGRAPVMAEPSPGQWIYSKTVQYQYPQGTSADEEWTTFDGGKTAYQQGGQLVVHTSPVTPPDGNNGDPLAAFGADITPKTAYDALAALPKDPSALLAAVDKAAAAIGAANLAAGTPVAGQMPKTRSQLEFDYLALLLWNAAGGVGGPPKAEAVVFRAMAALPGVTVQQGITDAAGAPAIGVSADGYDQLLLGPVSYQVIGLRQLSTGIGPKTPADPKVLAQLPKAERQRIERALKRLPPLPRTGAVIFSMAYAQVSQVRGPGLR